MLTGATEEGKDDMCVKERKKTPSKEQKVRMERKNTARLKSKLLAQSKGFTEMIK